MRIESYRISFVSRCDKCGESSKHDYSGLGRSHVSWIKRAKDTGYMDWRCDRCGHKGRTAILGIKVIKSK